MRIPSPKSVRRRLCRLGFVALAVSSAASLSSCTVVSIKADEAVKAAQSGNFNADTYVDALWTEKVLPQIRNSAHPIETVVQASASDPDEAGKAMGRQAGEGSPWTFAVTGEGTVVNLDRVSRAGTATIDTQVGPVVLQIGPVISGSAVRDALPFVNFNDFTNQVDFAFVSKALNEHAMKDIGSSTKHLTVGTKLRFTGVTAFSPDATPIRVTPVNIEVVS